MEVLRAYIVLMAAWSLMSLLAKIKPRLHQCLIFDILRDLTPKEE